MNTPTRDTLYLVDGKLPESFGQFAESARRFESEYYATIIHDTPRDEPFKVVDGERVYYAYVVGSDYWKLGVWIFEDVVNIDKLNLAHPEVRALGQWSLMFDGEEEWSQYGLTTKMIEAEWSTVQQFGLNTGCHLVHIPCANTGLDTETYDVIHLCLSAIMAWMDEHAQSLHHHLLQKTSTTIEFDGRQVEVTCICDEGLIGQWMTVLTQPQCVEKYNFDPYWCPQYGSVEDLIDGFDYLDRLLALFEISPEREAYLRAGNQPCNLPHVLSRAMRSEWKSPFWLCGDNLVSVMHCELLKDATVPICDVYMLLDEMRAFWGFLRSTFGYYRPCVDTLLGSLRFATELEHRYRHHGRHQPQPRTPNRPKKRIDRVGPPRLPRAQRRCRKRVN